MPRLYLFTLAETRPRPRPRPRSREAGFTLRRAYADETVSIQVVSGCVRLPGRTIELAPSQLLVLRAGIGHDVEARIDSAFVLTFGSPTEGIMP